MIRVPVVVVLCLSLGSCCLFKPDTCKTKFGNCVAEKTRGEFPDAVSLVEAALSGSTTEMVTKSLKLLEGLGVGLIVCAVQAVKDKHTPSTQPAGVMALRKLDPKSGIIIQNADAYLKSKGLKP
jgi:hypothetical protein